MAPRRTKQQWLELLEQQEASGLSAAKFCREKNISQKRFYYQARLLRQSTTDDLSPVFLRAKVAEESEGSKTGYAIRLQHGQTQLFLPPTIASSWVAGLMAALP